MEKVPERDITGKGGPPIISVPRPHIDHLLTLESYGNLSFVPNYVLVLDTQSHFRQFAGDTMLWRIGSGFGSTVTELGILGAINDEGSFEDYTAGTTGHRLVAVTSSVDSLVAACCHNHDRTPTVLVNDLSLLKSPQHFDTLAESYNLVVIADHADVGSVNELRKRNCKVWPLGEFEIELGRTASERLNGEYSVFDRVFAASTNSQQSLKLIPCECPVLDSVSAELEALNSSIKGEGKDELRLLVRKLFGLLNHASGILIQPSAQELADMRERVRQVRAELERQRHWITVEEADHVSRACAQFDQAFSDGLELGQSKREKLKAALREMKSSRRNRIGILTKREQHFEGIRAAAQEAGLDVSAFTAQPALLPDDFFDAVLCLNWPGSDGFQRFFHRYMAPDIRFMGYEFELRWLNQCRQKMSREATGPTIGNEEKSELIWLDPSSRIAWPESSTGSVDQPQPPADDFSILVFEGSLSKSRRGSGLAHADSDESVHARYVEFGGGRFAYVTEGHKLPVATALVCNAEAAHQRLPERDVSEWLVGDYIVFTGSQTEALHEIADKKMGAKAAPLRQRAHMWKDVLARCGISPSELHRKLGEAGCKRTPLTVRNWLLKDSQIGPESKHDLEAIAVVSRSAQLKADVEQVWAAIEEIRGYHLSAGTVLGRILIQKLPSVRHKIDEEGTEVLIEDDGKHLGSAHVVKIERIDPTFEPCSRSLVNRLRAEEAQLLLHL